MKKKLIRQRCEYDICDYCVYHDFNGKDLEEDGEIYKGAIYTGKGYCNLLKKQRDPCDGCQHFICGICNPKFNKEIRKIINKQNETKA